MCVCMHDFNPIKQKVQRFLLFKRANPHCFYSTKQFIPCKRNGIFFTTMFFLRYLSSAYILFSLCVCVQFLPVHLFLKLVWRLILLWVDLITVKYDKSIRRCQAHKNHNFYIVCSILNPNSIVCSNFSIRQSTGERR